MRFLILSAVPAFAGASLLVGLLSASPATPSPGVGLEHVYEYTKPLRWEGDLKADLDPAGHYLYVLEAGKGDVSAHVIDWRSGEEMRRVNLSDLSCDWETQWEIVQWEFVPKTSFIHLGCGASHYLLAGADLSVAHTLWDAAPRLADIAFSPDGNLVLVLPTLKEAHATAALYRLSPWEKVADMELEGRGPLFTQDGKHVVTLLFSFKLVSSVRVATTCGIAFYEVPAGKPVRRWVREVSGQFCPHRPKTVPQADSYMMLEDFELKQPQGYSVPTIIIWDAWTGEIARTINYYPDLGPSTLLSVSADGRFAVAGAWDDPQDSRWSRDFIIWDLQEGTVAYQAPKYRSAWGKNTSGREVYPHFSYDGKYLILVRERSVELLQIIPPATDGAVK